MKNYIPELGQACFGNPHSYYKCPNFIEAGLMLLESEIDRVYWNNNQKKWESCFSNNGGDFKLPEFTVRAYYWGDDENKEALPNFECDGLEIRWYKYLGRGMSMNKEIDSGKFFDIIDKCIEAVRKTEKTDYLDV
jgi:hypothetical protein